MDVSYGVLALALTLIAGTWTWFAYRRRGVGAGLKGAGITLLPVAAYLTETLRMFARVGDAVGDWATRLVLSPVVWVGIALAGLGVVLFGVGRAVEARGGGTPAGGGRDARDPRRLPPSKDPSPQAPGRPAGRGRQEPPLDDDLADIEAILRNRGIT